MTLIRDGEPRTATSTLTQLLSPPVTRSTYISMVLNVHRNHKAYLGRGGGGGGGGERGR